MELSPTEIVDATPTGSSSAGNILLPLLFIAIVAVALNGASDLVNAAPLASDRALKSNVTQVGQSPSGLAIYEFQYTGYDTVFRGVMAQDVLLHTPTAVKMIASGHLAVDYSMIDVDFTIVQ